MDVLHRIARTCNDMYTGIQAHTAHAYGFFNPWLVVDDVFLYNGMQDFMVGRDINGFGGFNRTVNIGLGNFAIFDFNHAL